jgi:hypothetical protein
LIQGEDCGYECWAEEYVKEAIGCYSAPKKSQMKVMSYGRHDGFTKKRTLSLGITGSSIRILLIGHLFVSASPIRWGICVEKEHFIPIMIAVRLGSSVISIHVSSHLSQVKMPSGLDVNKMTRYLDQGNVPLLPNNSGPKDKTIVR